MKVNADFDRPAVVHANRTEWVASPTPGVERLMLDRVGDEVARATSLVRYAAGSAFPAHVHDGGEEILVLKGVFQDEGGGYPAGSYVRNPPTSQHAPRSDGGCTIFVKLWQFDPADRTSLRVMPGEGRFSPAPGRKGVSVMPLYSDAVETVRFEVWAAGARVVLAPAGGLEVLVLEGSFEAGGERFAEWSWLRLPAGDRFSGVGGPGGCRVWVKMGHLATVRVPAGQEPVAAAAG